MKSQLVFSLLSSIINLLNCITAHPSDLISREQFVLLFSPFIRIYVTNSCRLSAYKCVWNRILGGGGVDLFQSVLLLLFLRAASCHVNLAETISLFNHTQIMEAEGRKSLAINVKKRKNVAFLAQYAIRKRGRVNALKSFPLPIILINVEKVMS